MKTSQWIVLILAVLLLAVPGLLLAGSYEVRPGIVLAFTDPPSAWQVSTDPPALLVQERAASMHPPQLEAARKAGFVTPEAAAQKMLQANELFLFNPGSGSHVEVDFSPLKPGEKPASARSLKKSAKYAAEELSHEEGLEKATTSVEKTRIEGAAAAYRVDATFLKHGQPTRFVGVITYAQGHWIFLYFTGPQAAAEDLAAVNRWLESINISGS